MRKNLLKGMLDILICLRDDARSFNDLKRLNLSPNTILARLREAQEKGFVRQRLYPRKGKKAKIKYDLTDEGELMLKDYESIIDRYLELSRELAELEKKLREKEREKKYLLLSSEKS